MKELDIIKLTMISKTFIVYFVLLVSIVSIFYSLSIKNQFTSTAILTPSESLNSKNIPNNTLGSFSTVIGLPQQDVGSSEHIANLSFLSRDFFKILYKNENFLKNLMAVNKNKSSQYNIVIDNSVYDSNEDSWVENDLYKNNKPSFQESHKEFLKHFGVKKNERDQIYELSYTSLSATNSKLALNLIIENMNEYIREKDQKIAQNNLKFLRELSSKTSNNDINVVISKLIEKELSALMLSNSSDSYVFDIIESPHEPELKSKPSRAIFCISAFFVSLFTSIFIVFVFGGFNKSVNVTLLPPKISLDNISRF